VDQIVHDCGELPVLSPSQTVLNDEQAGRFGGVILCRNVNPVITLGAGKHLAFKREWSFDFAFGYTLLREGIGEEFVLLLRESVVSRRENKEEHQECRERVSFHERYFLMEHRWRTTGVRT
jgi:hypothetical protein